MKNKFLLPIIILLTLSNSLKAQEEVKDTADYFKKNVCIVDFMIYSLNEKQYVRQIFVVDFKKSFDLGKVFNFLGQSFYDDGLRNDLKAGDGIYTSTEVYEYNEKVIFDPKSLTRYVSEKAVYHKGFLFEEELTKFLESYGSSQEMTGKPKIKVAIDCDVSWCSCSEECTHCYFPTPNHVAICIGCPNFSNCHLVFEIDW